MRRRRRQLLTLAVTAVAILLAGVAAFGGAVAGDTERIGEIWIAGRLDDNGLTVTEVIDYDFGYQQKHGIYRDIPDLLEGAAVDVSSPTAPDQAQVNEGFRDTSIRIGSPSETIWQRHRYRIEFTIERSAVEVGSLFSWNAVGTDWTVGMDEVTVALAVDADITGLDCQRGVPWDSRSCSVSQESGLVTVHLDDLGAGDAVTISGTLGADATPASLPSAPSGSADDPGTGAIPPPLVALAVAAVAGVPTRFLTRRAGREQVWQGGAADAAYGEADDGMPTTRMSERELAELATIEFEPPRGMSAVEGGLILDERVEDQHLTAWLLEAAIRDEVVLEGDEDSPELRRGSVPAAATVGPILETMFGGRNSVSLGSYDKKFTAGWHMLSGTLDDWADGADHWDRAGHRRQVAVRVIAVLVALVGLAVAVVGGVVANRSGTNGLYIVAVGAALVGGAGAALANSWELLVRTPKGSSLWLRIESFGRFLHDSEARHVAEAAERGVVRQYTAWAISLDEADAWTDAVDDAVGADPSLRSTIGRDLTFVAIGHHLGAATSAASTKPSSSGSGGFSGGFSGGAGGGGGGGGGGSW